MSSKLNLSLLREKINIIDDSLITLLDTRIEIAKEIGKIKKEMNVPVINFEREKEIIRKTEKAENYIQVKNIFLTIMTESRNIQEELICK